MFKLDIRRALVTNRIIVRWELRSDVAEAKDVLSTYKWAFRGNLAGGFRVGRFVFTWLISPPQWLRRAYNKCRFSKKVFTVRNRVIKKITAWRKVLRSNETVRLLLGLKFAVAVYEVDRAYGGPEEGGWWYTCGDLVRTVKRFRSEDEAYDYCRRINDKLHSRREFYGIRSSSSAAYSGGDYRAKVYDNVAPESFPVNRPYYC